MGQSWPYGLELTLSVDLAYGPELALWAGLIKIDLSGHENKKDVPPVAIVPVGVGVVPVIISLVLLQHHSASKRTGIYTRPFQGTSVRLVTK